MNCKHCEIDWLGQALASHEELGKGGVGERRKRGQRREGVGGNDDDREDVSSVKELVVIVDCRPSAEFGTLHITGAVSLSLPTLIQRRLLKGNLAMPVALGYCSVTDQGTKVTEEQWKSNTIVLYDDSTTTTQLTTNPGEDREDKNTSSSNSSSAKVIGMLLEHLRKEGYRACLLQGGLKRFKAKYPHFCIGANGDSDEMLQSGLGNLRITPAASAAADDRCEEPSYPPPDGATSTFPVEVLPHLFLGDAKNASDLECLQGNGIKYILNVTSNVPNKFENGGNFKYLQIPIKDHWSQNLTNYFPQAITFIDEGRRLNYGVLVHCLAGISRSVTVTVAYLMYTLSLSLNDAYDYVKRRKPNVAPNLTFMGQLLDFESVLKTTDDQRVTTCCQCQCHHKDDGDPDGSCKNLQSKCSSCQCPVTSPASTMT